MIFLKLDTYTGETYDVSAMVGLPVAYMPLNIKSFQNSTLLFGS